ncbi:uncharacterized protein LOC125740562 [Brienomyrus brachyistius]|uniref:uncharacterized protein LOC125740562 n=1 Tax=Brienomyrus brachyistius TaxID=42636 RepID=UPI0020B33B18|nr:uncharacterized protein LOC125740562 [Brienomyrus brachyistius]
MYGLEPIEESEELEEDWFLMVCRPSRRSHSLVKQSTPTQPEESRFTIGSDLAGTETASSDFSQATRSRRASPGRDHPAPLPSVEEGEDSGKSHSVSSPRLQMDVSRAAEDTPDAEEAEDAVTFPRQPFQETPTQSVSPSLIYDAVEDAADAPMDVFGKHRKAQPTRRKRMRSVDHRLPPKMKKRVERGVNRQRRGLDVPEWLINLMKDIEEATKYELVIE